jgi:hypothetical protein
MALMSPNDKVCNGQDCLVISDQLHARQAYNAMQCCKEKPNFHHRQTKITLTIETRLGTRHYVARFCMHATFGFDCVIGSTLSIITRVTIIPWCAFFQLSSYHIDHIPITTADGLNDA